MQDRKAVLDRYVQAVLNAPEPLHLTATRDPIDFWQRHVLDALRLIETFPPTTLQKHHEVLDLGSGNGVPGIPGAIANPQWHFDLMDSNNKKCGFLDMFCKNNEIKNVRVIPGRAEVLAHTDRREAYDLVFARALGKLPSALELAAGFVKVGGMIIVPHGTTWAAEVERSKKAMKELHLILKHPRIYKLDIGVQFTSLEFEKIAPTPEKYPRATGIPSKRPL